MHFDRNASRYAGALLGETVQDDALERDPWIGGHDPARCLEGRQHQNRATGPRDADPDVAPPAGVGRPPRCEHTDDVELRRPWCGRLLVLTRTAASQDAAVDAGGVASGQGAAGPRGGHDLRRARRIVVALEIVAALQAAIEIVRRGIGERVVARTAGQGGGEQRGRNEPARDGMHP
jgi:hypothetical protein